MKTARICGLIAGIALLYPLSTGPFTRFYLHGYWDKGNIYFPNESDQKVETFNRLYAPLFSLVGNRRAMNLYTRYLRVWLEDRSPEYRGKVHALEAAAM